MVATRGHDHAPNALIADNDAVTLRLIGAILRREGLNVALAPDSAILSQLLHERHFDLILADTGFSAGATTALAEASRLAPDATRIALATYAMQDSALLALRAGAYNYLMKPIDAEELLLTTRGALERQRLQRELDERMSDLEATHAELTRVNDSLRRQVAEATAELQQKVEELENTNQRLLEAQQANQRFIQMVAHEMRGPLNPIINYAQLAMRPTVDVAKRKEFMDSIVENAQRLNRLVGDLQTATSLRAGRFTLVLGPCDLTDLVIGLITDFRARLKDRNFMLDAPDGPLVIQGDADRIQQAIRNLLDNAVKYSTANGDIEARVWREGENAYISVADYGAGIPEDQMRRILEPFIRLQAPSSEISGSGLGLFITHGIAEAHGGELQIRNRKEARAQGAIFTLRLPVRKAEPAL
ncbi:MAG TPA: hybrid sensor histidine kinase/response regulator [Ktedonobacterales bacterium]